MPAGSVKTARKQRSIDPVCGYAQDVLSGRVVAGPWVRLACKRHLEDLQKGSKRGLYYDAEAAQEIFDFYDLLSTPEGDPFLLIDWQQFVLGSLFGWHNAEGFRRFRTAYIETGKGSGKSPLLGGIALFGLTIEEERLAEIYAIATKREQAKIIWSDGVNIYDNSPALEGRCLQTVNCLSCLETGSFFKPLSADSKKSSGFRPYIVLADEVHEHPNGNLLRIMRAGFKSRKDPLMLEITNSGHDLTSVCYQHHQYSISILKKTINNDSWFAYVCALDEQEIKTDAWKTDRRCWPKANPSLGKILSEKYLQEQIDEAKGMPANEAIVKRLNFCIWTSEEGKAIDIELWNKGGPDPATSLEDLQKSYQALFEKLRGRVCYGGLDLARVNDLSAFALYFPPTEDEPGFVLIFYWCPKDDIEARSQRDGIDFNYEVWARFLFIEATVGNTTDYGFIIKKILEICSIFQVKKIAFDRTFAGEVVQALMAEGIDMVEFGQGFLSMAAPMGELLRLVKKCWLQHGGHPVLRWNAANLVTEEDAAGNLKPSKSRSPEKIDGISALCNAIGIALTTPETGPSVYEQKGQLAA